MLDLHLLRSFVVVAETEHVGRAAERLHVSQSPLSRQIRKLEGDLGLALFHREKQRIRLTDAGRFLLGEARELLGRAARLEADAGAMARGERGRLRIGFVNGAFGTDLVPAALRRFQRALPDVRLEVRPLPSDVQLAAVVRGDLDLGLVHRASTHDDVVATLLFAEPFVLALPARHRLTKLAEVRAADLRGVRWVGLSRSLHPTAEARLARLGRKAGFEPEITHEASDRPTALALVASGLGACLLPASAAHGAPPGVAIRALPWLGSTSDVRLIRRKHPSAVAARLVDILLAKT